MRITDFINYPNANANNIASSQLSVKQCIIDVNSKMIAAGLVRSTDSGQLDTTSTSTISDVVLKKYTSTIDPSNINCYVAFAPMLYVLSDSWQTTNPVYIRYEFRIAQTNMYNNNISAPNAISYICYVNVKIGASTDGAGNITSQVAEQNLYHCYGINGSQSVIQYDYHNKTNSYILWNSTKGIVNVNICPNMYNWISPFPPGINVTTDKFRFSLIRFTLKRLKDGSCILIFPNLAYAASSISTSSYGASKIYYLYGTNIYSDTTNDTLNSFKQQRQNYVNNKIVTSPITVLLADGSLDYDPYILVGSTYILGNKSGIRYDVVINEGESYKYILWSAMDAGTYFDSTNTLVETSILIYDEEN